MCLNYSSTAKNPQPLSHWRSATTRQLKEGEDLFATDADNDFFCTSAFAIVRNGCLDIHCVEYGDILSNMANTSHASSAPERLNTLNTQNALTVPKDPIVSLTRGQTFGDQMVALGHQHIWAANPRRRRQVSIRFKVIAGDPSTEILWITRDQYEQLVREDQLRLSYTPIFGTACVTQSAISLACAIETREVSQITRNLLTSATLSKFFFQFPPIVLERFCHHMQIQRFESCGVLVETGGIIDNVYVVVTGALHTHNFRGSETDRSGAKKTLVHQGSARRMSLSQDVHFIPGDAFGARELMKRCYNCEAPVLADSNTILLCIARSPFERWVAPMRHNTIVKAGGILQPFVWRHSSPPSSPRYSYSPSFMKLNRRQSGPSMFSSGVVEPDRGKMRRLDEAAILLKRFGLFQTLPRFLLAQMLTQATLLCRSAGEELFREGDVQRALVVVLSGFVSFYSLENMSATVDMFQKHPFCVYAAFSGSTTNPEDYVSERKPIKNVVSSPTAIKHRAAMHGVHIQTLPSRNAFRTGVLQECTVCPATVLAQTNCEYLVFDESTYSHLLAEHVPAVNMDDYVVPPEPVQPPVLPAPVLTDTADLSLVPPQPTPKLAVPREVYRPGAIPSHLLSYLETARIPWLPPTSAKKTLLLRSMHHMYLAPGQRLIQHNEIMKQLVFVVSGKLAVYVRESQEVTSILNASQRSVQSAALERSVASNYLTTSQQLYQERGSIIGLSNRKALQRKIARISEMETLESEPESKSTSSNTRFTAFVLHAAKEAKTRQSSISKDLQTSSNSPPSTRRSLHSMVNKVKFQRKAGDQSTNDKSLDSKEASKTLFMLHLCPGDIYGDEITAPSGIFRSVHDIYADTSQVGSPNVKESGADRQHQLSTKTEVLCLDRYVLHSILAKTEEEAANELIGRASNAKAKWQLASQKLLKRASHSTLEDPGGYAKLKKTPKLFDFFKNILNQRRFLTMGALAHFPLLRDLPEDARRELCLHARFEALDRYTDAYKGNGESNGSDHRFFLLLNGRINLVANGPNSHIVTQGTNLSAPDRSLCEVTAGEGFGEFEILVPERRGSIPVKEVYLLKEGTCCIRQLVTLVPHSYNECCYDFCDDEHSATNGDTRLVQPKKSVKGLKVMATVADVSAGHVFWIDTDHCPITLVATSASVTIASISVDKLKAIVPRGLLASLEDLSTQLHEFYVQQFELAKRVTATVMNEKLAAQSQRLPAIQPCIAQNVCTLPQPCTNILLPSSIAQHQNDNGSHEINLSGKTEVLHDDKANSAYNSQHQAGRYEISNELSVSNLTGSFLTNTQSQERQAVSPLEQASLKQDECSSPEFVTGPTAVQLEEVTRVLRLDVKIPVGEHGYSCSRILRKSTTGLTEWRRHSMKYVHGTFKIPIDYKAAVFLGEDDRVLYEVDVRASVRAQMCLSDSPMRTIRLEPSHIPSNSLGKYFDDSPSPFTKLGDSYRRQRLQWQNHQSAVHTKPYARPPKHKPPKVCRPNPNQRANSIEPSPRLALTRKQGFLTALRVRKIRHDSGDVRDILEAVLPRIHQGRRFFFVLIDNELREYADTISLNSLNQTKCRHCYNLCNPGRACSVSDVPVTPGHAEALLRQSFLLLIDEETQFFCTASSAMDKQKWMTELSQACTLAELEHPVSIKAQLSRPIVATPPPADPASLEAVVIDAFKGRRKSSIKERKRSSIFVPKPKSDDALQVEYHIS
ncbi:unnamed protein product [Phytophthora lilii]|uniref:Unnamed protein product n=1 Tax=Phytophthora lilii TaxID=2077276 RepID=A0A9W6WZP8_9STRA|nr:unnamed protein product [Phytophthora lilii]